MTKADPMPELSDLREELENLRSDHELLASNLVYKGNSVQWWESKAKAYKDAIGKVCNVAQKHGIVFDGNTDVADLLDAHLATRTKAPQPAPDLDLAALKELAIEDTNDHSGCMELAINWLYNKGYIRGVK